VTGATLYRCRAPTDWLCPCGRVARELARAGYAVDEERVPWRRRDRDGVEEASGQRVVPVVEFDDGDVVCDSRRIAENLRWRARQRGARSPG
jgi:glutathione S-transferase